MGGVVPASVPHTQRKTGDKNLIYDPVRGGRRETKEITDSDLRKKKVLCVRFVRACVTTPGVMPTLNIAPSSPAVLCLLIFIYLNTEERKWKGEKKK